MSVNNAKKAFAIRVARPELHHKDNFTMQVPVQYVDVVPLEDDPWGMIVDGEKFQSIDITYEGKATGKLGYQAAILRFQLQDDYEWFGDGIEVVAIENDKKERFPKLHFKTFFEKRSSNQLDMTIQVTRQQAFHSEIKFRFIACEKHQQPDANGCVKVLVSEDPVVIPNKPVGDQ